VSEPVRAWPVGWLERSGEARASRAVAALGGRCVLVVLIGGALVT
jgi:hypothetical protein